MEKEKLACLLNDRDTFFSIALDSGSKRLSKTYPVLVYVYDPTQKEVVWKVLGVGFLGETERSTSDNMLKLVESQFESSNLEFSHLMAFGADNTNAMAGTVV